MVEPLTEISNNETYLERLDPRVKLISLFTLASLLFIITDPIIILLILGILLTIWVFGGIPIRRLTRLLTGLVPLLLFTQIANGFLIPGRLLFTIDTYLLYPFPPSIGFSFDGSILALSMNLRILSIVIATPLLVYSTSINRLINGLVKLKMPYTLAFITSTALNLLPSFEKAITTISEAQRARGYVPLDQKSLFTKIRAYIPLLIPLIVASLRNADQLQTAIYSRAYGVSKTRTYYFDLKMGKADWSLLFLFITLVSYTVLLRVTVGFGALDQAMWFLNY
jgi:energy-coupling factor transport system permease protein